MITAVDTSVLLDILLPDPLFGRPSARALDQAEAEGALIICEPVYAEIAAQFISREKLEDVVQELGLQVGPLGREAAFLAGRGWHAYRRQAGKREHIITDFLIGAHAQVECTRLLTRDRGFYRKYFRSLSIFNPTP